MVAKIRAVTDVRWIPTKVKGDMTHSKESQGSSGDTRIKL